MEESIIRLTDGSVSAAVSLFGRRAKSLRLGIESQPYRLGATNSFKATSKATNSVNGTQHNSAFCLNLKLYG